MTLPPGSRLGAFEITAQIGEGGMGAVYRARDLKLSRDVAIKVLLPAVAGDPERLARFGREAQLLASLNHPHIAQIYGLEDEPSETLGPFLVLELVEGPTLADRIAASHGRGLPLDEALAIAKQVAEALEAAHEHGIIHRDLKPANIKVRDDGTVKVLDFGLAKAIEQAGHPANAAGNDRALDTIRHAALSHSPTMTSPPLMTAVGVLLGTAAYMSPEQARGREVDTRADIWAFGCVLYEMITGERAFRGDDLTDTLAAIVRDQPDPDRVPHQVRRLIDKCLQKDPRRRLRDIGDAWDLLDDKPPTSNASPSSSEQPAVAGGMTLAAWIGWALAVVATTVASWTILSARRQQPPPTTTSATGAVTWLNAALPDQLPFIPNTLHRSAVITPDGGRIVYTTRNGIAVRQLDSGTAILLPGTEGGRAPFVSQDGQQVGFAAETQGISWTPIRGGPLQSLVTAIHIGTGGFLGAAFLPDGGVVFASAASAGLMRTTSGGAAPTRLTSIDRSRSERLHQWPAVLPDGRGVLFTIASGQADRPTYEVAAVDLASGRSRTLASGSQPAYVEGGYITFIQDGRLLVASFDRQKLELTSTAVPMGPEVAVMQLGASEYSVSRNGTLVFLPGPVERLRTLVWMDRSGRETALPVPRLNYVYPRVSPDGQRLAVDIRGTNAQNGYIAVYDLGRQVLARLSLGMESAQYPVWRDDSRSIFFQTPGVNLMSQSIDGGRPERIAPADAPLSFDPKGGNLLVGSAENGVRWLSLVPLRTGAPRSTLMRSESAWIPNGEFSPDGRFLAVQSAEPGRYEVFVVPFPDVTSARWQISTAGGTRPAWSRNGKELFYLDLSGALMRVPTSMQPTFSAGTPEKLFDSVALVAGFPPGRNYDVAPDGRFLMVKDNFINAARPLEFTIALNWAADFRARLGARP